MSGLSQFASMLYDVTFHNYAGISKEHKCTYTVAMETVAKFMTQLPVVVTYFPNC